MTNEERETLVDIKKAAESGLSCISCGNDGISQLWKIVRLCDAALSKPARNCDRFCSIEQAKAAYCEEVRNVFIWDGDESGRFEKWFLAPAKQKGENQ